DPAAALAWAQENDRNLDRDLYRTVLTTIADVDPQLALMHAKELEPGRQRTGALFFVAQRLAERDPALAARLVDDLGDNRMRHMILQVVANHWLQSDPQA